MFEDKDSPIKFEEDIENMKVIDIKKRLKALGLSPTGNKSELVERLQVAMLSSGKDSSGDTASFPDSLSDLSPTKLNDQLLEDAPPSPKKELPAQDQMVTSGTPSVIPAVPLKKRAVLQTQVETVKPKKRIVLNRNNFPTPILSQAAVEPVKVVSSSENGKKEPIAMESENGKKEAIAMEAQEIPTTSGSIKKVVSLATEKKKVLTDAEKIALRAKRFNLTPEAIKAQNLVVPAKKKAHVPAKKEWKPKVPAISPYTIPTNIDVLKKRAKRFGENVSTVLIKLEDQEKINKRKSKFGEIKVDSLDEQEKKKMRAERFKY